MLNCNAIVPLGLVGVPSQYKVLAAAVVAVFAVASDVAAASTVSYVVAVAVAVVVT